MKATEGDHEVPTSIRLHRALVDRVDALIGPLAADPAMAPSGRLSRSDVIRLALLEGLPELERRARDASG